MDDFSCFLRACLVVYSMSVAGASHPASREAPAMAFPQGAVCSSASTR